jgi:hypothetical protein
MKEPLDELLQQALRQEEPPGGFAEQVLARVRELSASDAAASTESPGGKKPWPWEAWARLQSGRGLAVAVAGIVLLLVAGGLYQRERTREQTFLEQQVQARDQALYALRLTGEKIGPAQRVLAQLGIDLGAPVGHQPPVERVAR